VPRREEKKPKQPPFILLDHNVQIQVAEQLSALARFRQVGERERERRFRRDTADLEIHRGPRRFLFVTHDQDFLRQDRLPNQHGGILVFVCPPRRLAQALRRFLDWWGPKRNLLRNRVFRLTTTGGVEILRDGSPHPVFRQPQGSGSDSYGNE
jgi:predicted nuclease of predicted toxin-antitoxin system